MIKEIYNETFNYHVGVGGVIAIYDESKYYPRFQVEYDTGLVKIVCATNVQIIFEPDLDKE